MTNWRVSTITTGYAPGFFGEEEVEGTVISPDTDDEYNVTSLDMKEAAEYINILEAAIDRVVDAYIAVCEVLGYDDDLEKEMNDSIAEASEILTSDAWTLVRARQNKEI